MNDKDDIRLLYQVQSSQIEFSKAQQWRIAYYTLLFIGGVVGASQLVYNDFKSESSIFVQISLFILAVIIPPLVIVCDQLIRKNEKAMCGAREAYMKMWARLSWPFKSEWTGESLVGEAPRYTPGIYDKPIYDKIFWLPPIISTYGAGVFSYLYLILKFRKIVSDPWILLLNIIIASVLCLAVFFTYHHWDCILNRKAQKRRSKATSLRDIFKRICVLARWICTGQTPPCAHSHLHGLLIKYICKGQDPAETLYGSDP